MNSSIFHSLSLLLPFCILCISLCFEKGCFWSVSRNVSILQVLPAFPCHKLLAVFSHLQSEWVATCRNWGNQLVDSLFVSGTRTGIAIPEVPWKRSFFFVAGTNFHSSQLASALSYDHHRGDCTSNQTDSTDTHSWCLLRGKVIARASLQYLYTVPVLYKKNIYIHLDSNIFTMIYFDKS